MAVACIASFSLQHFIFKSPSVENITRSRYWPVALIGIDPCLHREKVSLLSIDLKSKISLQSGNNQSGQGSRNSNLFSTEAGREVIRFRYFFFMLINLFPQFSMHQVSKMDVLVIQICEFFVLFLLSLCAGLPHPAEGKMYLIYYKIQCINCDMQKQIA